MHRIEMIADIRSFNRFYTNILGLLDKSILDSGYSLAEVRVLFEISSAKHCTANQLCSLLGMDRSYMSRILSRFEKMGLITRTASKTDARHMEIRLSDEGYARLEQLNALSNDHIRQLIQPLGYDDCSKIIRAMKTIQGYLTDPVAKADEIMFRKAIPADMDEILELQRTVFMGEQKIPAAMIPLAADSEQQWWCATAGTAIIGTVAAWKEQSQIHWGRFAIRPEYRGQHLGTRLAQFSLDELFSQPITEIHMEARDITAKLIVSMGGTITGTPTRFFDGMVTPVVLTRTDYLNRSG